MELAEAFSKTSPQADAFLREVCFWTVGDGTNGTSILEAWLLRGYRPRQKNDPPQRTELYPGDDLAFNECLDRGVKAALLMLNHGADPEQLSSIGKTPVGQTIEQMFLAPEYLAVVLKLLQRGADPNQPSEYGDVVLDRVHGLLQREHGNLRARFAEAEKLLVNHGAKTRAQLEKEGAIKPLPKPERPIPVR